MIPVFLLLCLAPLTTYALDTLHRSHLHLLINDPKTALKEIDANLSASPDAAETTQLLKLKIECASQLNNEELLLATYKRLASVSEADANAPDVLERVAWGVIQNAKGSDSPIIRTEAAFAACVSGDAQGVPLFKSALHDPNVTCRLIAFELASNLRDELIENTAIASIESDPSQAVQLAAISSLGAMRSLAARARLQYILEEEHSSAEHKMAAVTALVKILHTVDGKFLTPLIHSRHYFLRMLACNLVTNYHLKDELEQLLPLLNDTSQTVRMAALEATGTVAPHVLPPAFYSTILALTEHPDWKQSIRANWVIARKGNEADAVSAQKRLHELLHHHNQEARLLAAATLKQSGMATLQGAPLDHYVLLTLCIGMIYERNDIPRAARVMEQAMQTQERISWQHSGIFSWIGPTTLCHSETQPRMPETQDFFTRLQLYSMLATCGVSDLHTKLQKFFKEESWGISGTAACLLLQEEEVFVPEVLYSLLESPSHEISLQAACILALYTQEPRALAILEGTWKSASREQKEYILYAMGTIGSTKSLPFLIHVLDEPFQTLRIRAASAILQCLFH